MRRVWALVVAGCLVAGGRGLAAPPALETEGWRRIDSRYCTMWLHPSLEVGKINKKISTWRVRPRGKAEKDGTPAEELAAKCDTLFRRAQEVLDMYVGGLHTTVKIVPERDQVERVHAARYGHGTKAVAIYVFEENTIYAAAKDLSESVLIHEMAHSIIDHYFGIRPPRKIEEMLAIHVDSHMRD